MFKAAVRLLFVLLALGTVASAAPRKKHGISDLDDTISRNIILSKFATLVNASGMGTFLSSRGPFTLFAPTNSAFSKLPPGEFENLLRPENHTQLQRIVLFHLINLKPWLAMDLKTVKSLPTCEGSLLTVKTTKRGTIFIDKARLLRADDHCANGVLHEIDTLLMPPHCELVPMPAGAVTPPAAAPATAPPVNAEPASQSSGGTNAAPADSSDTNVPPVPKLQ